MEEGFKRILVLIDFSGASFQAAEEAAMIATKFNGELHLLHVSSNSGLSWLLAPEANQNGNVLLDKIKIDLEKRFELTIECHETDGKLCETINKYVDTLRIDLVVLGAKKRKLV